MCNTTWASLVIVEVLRTILDTSACRAWSVPRRARFQDNHLLTRCTDVHLRDVELFPFLCAGCHALMKGLQALPSCLQQLFAWKNLNILLKFWFWFSTYSTKLGLSLSCHYSKLHKFNAAITGRLGTQEICIVSLISELSKVHKYLYAWANGTSSIFASHYEQSNKAVRN